MAARMVVEEGEEEEGEEDACRRVVVIDESIDKDLVCSVCVSSEPYRSLGDCYTHDEAISQLFEQAESRVSL